MIIISIADQKLYKLDERGNETSSYIISSAKRGIGQAEGSYQTPLGLHYVTELYGHGAKLNTVFVGRVPTGETYSTDLAKTFPDRDWILTRIIRFSGLEPGFNQGGSVDTYARYIYIHGCPDGAKLGVPGSHGCIRMSNYDLTILFDSVVMGEIIYITAAEFDKSILLEINNKTKSFVYTDVNL